MVSDPSAAWAASGAMSLTGRADGPALLAPPRVIERMAELAASLADLSDLAVDGPALLGERAALAGLSRQGATSCGGATRLLPAADGWIAVCLARAEDISLLPAWLGVEVGVDQLPGAIRDRLVAELAERAGLLGVPATRLGEAATLPAIRGIPFPAAFPAAGEARDLVVVDLSSLWAGPLCAQLLQASGARVIKVETEARPDGARAGPAAFFDLLHAGQESVALDFASPAGRTSLRRLLETADIVIEASRRRALSQLGADATEVMASGRPRVWVSITGFGRQGEGPGRVAFGDDASAAGGLVVWDGDGPCFCADAVADPATGLLAAQAVLSALAHGGQWLLDLALSGVAAELAGPFAAVPFDGRGYDGAVAPPRARPPRGTAPALGQHTEAVLHERCR